MDISVDYDMGAYGMTIRIDVKSRDALIRLRDFIGSMVDDFEKPFEAVGGCEILVLNKFQLKQIPVGHKDGRSVIVNQNEARWENPFEEWIRCKGLLDGLLMHGKPAHQYLSREGIDDALIEVSYLNG